VAQRNASRVLTGLAGVLLLAALFVSYRARSFRYCASMDERPQARIAGSGETCSPGEEPLDARRLGWPGRIKLAAKAAAKAFGAN
jgi:hypothetical protein